MTTEFRRDTDIVGGPSIEDVRQETAAVKAQYMDAQQQRTIDSAVGEATAALEELEARLDAIEARLEHARRDQYLGALKAQLSRPVKAHELDAGHRHYLFGKGGPE
jgi:ATPase subunit of ABC transporter with duplicated ATPase domains